MWRADGERVRQVVLNLLTDAIKFMPLGGMVRAPCGRLGSFVCVEVLDTGPRIPPEQRERIFEPCVQLDRSLARPQKVTGLGPAISRDLAAATIATQAGHAGGGPRHAARCVLVRHASPMEQGRP